MVELSAIIPVYNEEKSILSTISKLKETLKKIKKSSEIIVINDGSTDKTGNLLKKIKGIVYVQHITNKGYGASLKTGIKESKGKWIVIMDADGTYPIGEIPRLFGYTKNNEMVIGARIKNGAGTSLLRAIGKWPIKKLAEILYKKCKDKGVQFIASRVTNDNELIVTEL